MAKDKGGFEVATAMQRKIFSKLNDEEKQSAVRRNSRMEDAEQKARVRERKAESALKNKLDGANGKVKELRDEASRFGLGIHKKRERSNIKHVQFIQENWGWMKENGLLTTSEKAFLIDIVDLVQFASNAICKKTKTGQTPCNISELSVLLKRDLKHMREIVSSLTDKGVLFVGETGVDGINPENAEEPHPARAKMMLVNPRLMHSGYNENVNETLKSIFKRSLTKVPVKMF